MICNHEIEYILNRKTRDISTSDEESFYERTYFFKVSEKEVNIFLGGLKFAHPEGAAKTMRDSFMVENPKCVPIREHDILKKAMPDHDHWKYVIWNCPL